MTKTAKTDKPIKAAAAKKPRMLERRFTTCNPDDMIGYYTTERVLKTWTEDHADKATGEIVSVERNEIIVERGTLVTPELTASIRFAYNAGDITAPITLSDQQRQAEEGEIRWLQPFKVTAEIGGKNRKFLLVAQSAARAIDVARDWIELNYKGTFGFTAVAMLRDVIIIEPEPVDAGDRDAGAADIEAEKQYYKADVDVTVRFMETGIDPETHNFTCIIRTLNADTAKEEAAAWVEKRVRDRQKGAEVKDVRPTLIMAAPFACTEIISREFCEAYRRSDDKQSKNQLD